MAVWHYENDDENYRVSQKRLYTFEMAAKWKVFDSGGKVRCIGSLYGLNFHNMKVWQQQVRK